MEAERALVTDPKSHSLEVAETKLDPDALSKPHALRSGVQPYNSPLPAVPPRGVVRVGRGGQIKGLQDGMEGVDGSPYLGSWLRAPGKATLRAGGPGDPRRSKTWKDRMGPGEDLECQVSPAPPERLT